MPSLAGCHILVVEDEPLLAFDYADELETHGARLSIALTLADAMAQLEIGYPDMAVLDVNLGLEFSWPVATALTKQGVPFLLVTGCNVRGSVPAGVTPNDCLDKPVGAHMIARCLKRMTKSAS